MNASRTVNWMAIAAILFGALTVLTGSRALFGSLELRADFGNAVPFVLWFNFLAGWVPAPWEQPEDEYRVLGRQNSEEQVSRFQGRR